MAEADPGLPLAGLSEAELRRFAEGRALFNRPFTAEEGLGPIFNQDRCSSCHDLPTSGGHGAEPVVKVSRFDPSEGCSSLSEHGGDLLQHVVTESARALGVRPEQMPEGTTATSAIRASALYGLGLVEAVDEEELLRRADPDDADGDGISGRARYDAEGRMGRFGRKAQHATLRGFVEEAIRLEMGLTTPTRPEEERPSGQPLPPGADTVPEPEVGEAELELLADYIRFLAPPLPRLLSADAPRAPGPGDDAPSPVAGTESREMMREIDEGERVFDFAGCANCHVPVFTTAPNDVPALDRQRFRLYSDLLLHDMGPGLADICTVGSAPSEWKTARLVGLGHRAEFLHDGRAASIEDAILFHGGEAAAARSVYQRLTPAAHRQLLAFLRSL